MFGRAIIINLWNPIFKQSFRCFIDLLIFSPVSQTTGRQLLEPNTSALSHFSQTKTALNVWFADAKGVRLTLLCHAKGVRVLGPAKFPYLNWQYWHRLQNIAIGTTDPGYWVHNLSKSFSWSSTKLISVVLLELAAIHLHWLQIWQIWWRYLSQLQTWPLGDTTFINWQLVHHVAPIALA